MDAKKIREFYLDYLNTIYHERRIEQLDRFYTDDVVLHPPLPGAEPGLAGLRYGAQMWLDAFSDLHITLHDLVYDKDKEMVALRITLTGVHSKDFMGIPATGRRFEIIDQPHYRLRDGKFAELWDCPDMMTLLQQLGAIPSLPQAA